MVEKTEMTDVTLEDLIVVLARKGGYFNWLTREAIRADILAVVKQMGGYVVERQPHGDVTLLDGDKAWLIIPIEEEL